MSELVGRDDVLAAGRYAMRLDRSMPVAFAIEGDPGIGKSAVWQAMVVEADANADRVLQARPVEAETSIAYAGLSDLLSDLGPTDWAPLPEPQRNALEVTTLRREPGRPLEDVRLIGTSVAGLLRLLAADGPVVIAIDDAHWLDDATSTAVSYALRRSTDLRICLLLSHRVGWVGRLTAMTSPDCATKVTLAPLDASSIREVVRTRLGVPLSLTEATRLHRLTGGNPYYALELASAVSSAPTDEQLWAKLADRSYLPRLTEARIERLPRRTRVILAYAAALGEPTADILASAVGTRATLDRWLRPARTANLVHRENKRIRFEHPLLAAAAYAGIGAEERRALHRRLGVVSSDPEERAHHLSLGHDATDDEVAAEIEAGAARASARGAPEVAARLCTAALRLTPESSTAIESRRLATATYLARAGRLDEARGLYERLLEEKGTSLSRGHVLRLLAELRLQQDSFDDAIRLLRLAVDDRDSLPPDRVLAGLELTYGLVQTMAPLEARAQAIRARDAAIEVGFPALLATALAVDQMTGYLVGEGADLRVLERAAALEPSDTMVPSVFRVGLVAGNLHYWMGALGEARTTLGGVARQLSDIGDEAGLVYVLLLEAWVLVAQGDLPEASLLADRSLEIAERLGAPVLVAQGLMARARVRLMRGDPGTTSDCERSIDLAERSGWRAGPLFPWGILGSLAWSQGDGMGTVRILEPLLKTERSAGFADPGIQLYVADLLEALVALGERRAAQDLIDDLQTVGDRVGRPWALAVAARGRALLLAGAGQLAASLAAIDAALDHLKRIDPWPHEEARTLLVRGRIERRMKRRAAARASLERARAIFHAIQAEPWERRAETELARLGRRGAPEALTETETRVAELAAKGLTNRQVAELVFVTPKSVEGILARIYGKLAISSRAELGAWAAHRETAADPGTATSLRRTG